MSDLSVAAWRPPQPHPPAKPGPRAGTGSTGSAPRATAAVLAAAVFVIGTAESVMTGLVPALAADFDRSVSTAGSLVGWYALTVTLAGPLVTAALLRLPPRRVLLGRPAAARPTRTAERYISTPHHQGRT